MKKTFPFPIGTVHIVGIGGIGMSGYAEVLHSCGYQVQGSDQAENANVQRLRAMGVRVIVGHESANVLNAAGAPCTVVVRSTAVKEANPEIIAAHDRKIPVIERADLLAELMRSKWCVAVSGTHGKTTTTSMVGHVLEKAGLDPTVINGGIVNAYGTNARVGAGGWMVVEADESDGTFMKLPSVISVITNIDPEHLDHYGTFDVEKEAFVSYVRNLPFYGVAVVCIDHPVVAELIPQFLRRTVTYGFAHNADVRAENVQTTPDGLLYDVVFAATPTHAAQTICGVRLPMFGTHNVLNSLAAFTVAREAGVEPDVVAGALQKFSGVKRRFTTTGIVNGITVIDDYGHHPVEIAAVLKAAREAIGGQVESRGRVIAVIQPHRYSRLSALFDQFCACAGLADEMIVADVYSAGESPIAGVNKDTLAEGMRKIGHKAVHVLSSPDDLAALVYKIAKPGDFVICLGAGSVTQWAQALPRALEEQYGSAPRKANGTA